MIGQTVSHYRIVKKIGEGGMGVVYLAEDTHLGRQVAIKFLSDTHDRDYRARFLREARAVSSLSHPHIAIIHDYGETAEDQPFIVMEYIKGETLSELLNQSALTISRALEIIEAVAEALGAAHARGIIHRDIKPSNVLVDEEGRVKVLDFGLAKQLHDDFQTVSPDANTLMAGRTSSNLVVGTPLYLSPEQAMGASVDARSDLFALGTLLYECLTGKPAFSGGSVIEIGARIIHFNPPPPSSLNKRVSAELDRITLKALTKNPEARYQSAGEIVQELQAARVALNDEEGHRTQRLHDSRGTHSSALKSISETLRRPRVSIGFFVLALIVSLGSWFIFQWARTKPPAPFQNMSIAKLTNTGRSVEAVISPDGKYVVYVMDDGGPQSLWVRQVATGSDVPIVAASRSRYEGLTFSPDGNYIHYLSIQSNGPKALFQVPTLGGISRKLLVDIDSPITFSPDGKHFGFVRSYPDKGVTALVIANTAGTEERELASRKAPNFFYVMGPAWSPAGKTIACAAGSSTGGFHQDVVEVSVADGAEHPVTSHRWFIVDRVAWLSDSSGLILTASDQALSPFQIWQISYPDGEARRVTNDLNNYRGMSLTGDSRYLVTVQSDYLSNIWVAPCRDGILTSSLRHELSVDTSRARQITSGAGKHYGLSWTPDSRIVYSSNASGNPNLWIMDSNGMDQKQLAAEQTVDRDPSVSADGRYIVFSSNRMGVFNIWRIDADGSNPKRLTNGSDEEFPQCSPDGRWVIYQGFVSGVPTIWKVPIEGGEALQLSDKYSNWPAVSPDGTRIACSYRDDANSQWRLAVIPIEGGQPIRLFDMATLSGRQRIRWTADGTGLTYIDNYGGISNLWKQPLSGEPPKQLTDFKSDQIFNFAWTRDGKQLAYVRGVVASDVVLVGDNKPVRAPL